MKSREIKFLSVLDLISAPVLFTWHFFIAGSHLHVGECVEVRRAVSLQCSSNSFHQKSSADRNMWLGKYRKKERMLGTEWLKGKQQPISHSKMLTPWVKAHQHMSQRALSLYKWFKHSFPINHTNTSKKKKKKISGKSFLVQWLGLHASMIEGMGSILGKGTKSPTSHLVQTKNKIRFKK